MQELAKVTLENEMDLILAHKRAMKLAELAGLSLSAQTTFATAVSEVARNTIESEKKGCLILCVDADQRDKYIVATIQDSQRITPGSHEGLEYAKKLVNKVNVTSSPTETKIELFYYFAPTFKVDLQKVDEWRSLFRNEPPISAYDELKRKNEQMKVMSDKLQKSEDDYRSLTNSLPLIIFSINQDGEILYANDWLRKYTGHSVNSVNKTSWQSIVHPDDNVSFFQILHNNAVQASAAVTTQARLKNISTGEYLWHQVSLSPFNNDQGELQYWTGFIVDIHAQKVYEETLKDNIELKETQKQLKQNQQTLETYIDELNRSNRELQQFAFVASHDLQEPVRKLLFYCDYLLKKYTGTIDQKGIEFLTSMQAASIRMRNLIQDLLAFSQINQEERKFTRVDLNQIAKDSKQDLEMAIQERGATVNVSNLPVIEGDERMMRQLFGNMISNSIKYSKTDTPPIINITCQLEKDSLVLSFQDNGIGFDEKYLPQMFTLFQRLHAREKYQGTGIGLAICRKIADIHKGRIWAKATEGEGATFYVSLPTNALVG